MSTPGSSTKNTVLRLFLDFVRDYVPLSEARFATLGGEGLEASLWHDIGVQPRNGWLIERNRELSRRLIRSTDYCYCADLRSFPQNFQSVCGRYTGIDAFHLDLCGTFESKVGLFANILPLVSRSQGRCWALTVSDQRRNRTLDSFSVVRDSSEALTGKAQADSFFQSLLDEQRRLRQMQPLPAYGQPFDPENGARREFGLFVNAIKLLKGKGPWWHLPDTMERYVYISRFGRGPCRMRTYFFHLGSAIRLSREEAVRRLINVWQSSDILYFNRDLTRVVSRFSRKELPVMLTQFPKLAAIADAVGGDAKKEFDTLLEMANQAPGVAQFLVEVRRALDAVDKATPRGSAASPNLDSVSTARVTRGKQFTTSDATGNNGKSVEIQLQLLRASAQGKEQLAAAKKEARGQLDVSARKKRQSGGRMVGGLLARTSGKFRSDFVSRAVRQYGVEILVELAQIYSKQSGKTVTVEDLKREVK